MLAALLLQTAAVAPLPDLPARQLDCTLGRATNLDTSRPQLSSEVIYEGSHQFGLFLPAGRPRTGPPPEPIDPPDPVDPRTRITADPDKLTQSVPKRFDRVVDYWPERVEMVTTIDGPLVNLIVINPIDPVAGTAWLYMTRAQDVATIELDRVYSGPCKVTTL